MRLPESVGAKVCIDRTDDVVGVAVSVVNSLVGEGVRPNKKHEKGGFRRGGIASVLAHGRSSPWSVFAGIPTISPALATQLARKYTDLTPPACQQRACRDRGV